jgi:spore germination protein GerM
MRSGIAALAVALVFAGCGANERETITVYLLEGRDTPLGYRGRLAPVKRSMDAEEPRARAAVEALLLGPTASEEENGFISPLEGMGLLGLEIVRDRAIVDLSGTPPRSVDAGGQLLYALTELPGIRRVSLRLNGEPCCFWTHDGEAIETVTRATLRYWGGEPCHLRTTATHARCRTA